MTLSSDSLDADDASMFTEADVILGGETQSVDPTRYDYVPPSDEAADGDTGDVAPMDAVGVQSIGGFTYTWKGVSIGVPATYLQHTIYGDGLTIDNEYADYLYGSPLGLQVCNYRTAFQNRYGSTIYSTRWAPLHSGCSYIAFSQSVSGPFTVQTGAQCARYYVNGVFRGEQCHNVFS